MKIRHCKSVKRLTGTTKELYEWALLLCEPYVASAVSPCFTNPVDLHYQFTDLELGYADAWGAYDEKDEFLGLVFGELANGVFTGHLFFYRNASALECVSAIEKILIQDYAKENKEVTAFRADIPEYNRAAKRVALRFGCKDMGVISEQVVIRGDDKREYKVNQFVKSLDSQEKE